MAKTIEINGTVYEVPELDFNAIAELSENGVDILSRKIAKKSALTVARGVAAWIMGTDVEEAGREIQDHMLEYGELPPVIEILREEVNNSVFIKKLSEKRNGQTLRKTPQDHKRKQTKTEE